MKKFCLTLIFVGRMSDNFIKEGCRVYGERIRRYADLDLVVVPEERVLYKGKKDYIVRQEGQRIREKLRHEVFVVALDEKGKFLSSDGFADSLNKWSDSGSKEIDFLLGGPYGLEEAIRKEADFCLSLSPMTLPHGLARLLLFEQIYRAFTILRGEPYHK